ncbi:glycosyltransferase, partial [Candidatus Latescibacterota bacterium]
MAEKKIFYIHTGEWPSPSPSIVFISGTVYGLAHHYPTVLIIRNNSEEPTEKIFHTVTGAGIPPQLDIQRSGLGGKTPGHSRFFRDAVKRIGVYAKKGEVCAVITRSIGFLPYLVYIRRLYNIPCLFETHDFFGDLSLRTDLKKTPRIYKNRLYERLFLPRLDGLICLTETQAELFRRLYPSLPIVIAPTGLMDVKRSESKREKQVCYVGSLDAHKGLGIILSAFTHITDSELKLFVIGGKDEHEMREFMNLARLAGVDKRVCISGWVHHSDIGHMMDRCIAGIVPLTDTPFNRFITSPLKILDYFSRSLPVIASDLPAVREFIEDGKHGLLFPADNPERLAETLDRYVTCSL